MRFQIFSSLNYIDFDEVTHEDLPLKKQNYPIVTEQLDPDASIALRYRMIENKITLRDSLWNQGVEPNKFSYLNIDP